MQKFRNIRDNNGRSFTIAVGSVKMGSGLTPSRIELKVKDQAEQCAAMTLEIKSGQTLYLLPERKLVTVEDWWNSSILVDNVLNAVHTTLIGHGLTLISVAESDRSFYYTPVVI